MVESQDLRTYLIRSRLNLILIIKTRFVFSKIVHAQISDYITPCNFQRVKLKI